MTLQLKGLDKRGRNAIYTGAAVSLRFPLSAFPAKMAPSTLEINGLAKPLTAEERKALRAAARKARTPQDELARLEARMAALRAKLASTPAPAPAPPAKPGYRWEPATAKRIRRLRKHLRSQGGWGRTDCPSSKGMRGLVDAFLATPHHLAFRAAWAMVEGARLEAGEPY